MKQFLRRLVLLALGAFILSFSFGVYTQDIRVGELLLRGGERFPSTTPVYDFFSLLNNKGVLKPSGWNFIDAAGISLDINKQNSSHIGITIDEKLLDHHVLVISAHPNVAPLTPSERELLRAFLQRGGLLWVHFQVPEVELEDFFLSLPWPTCLTRVKSLLELDQPGFSSFAPYPNLLSRSDFRQFKRHKTRIVGVGDGKILFTAPPAGQSENYLMFEELKKEPESPFAKLLMNTIVSQEDFCVWSAHASRSFSTFTGVAPDIFLHRRIDHVLTPPIYFRGRCICIVERQGRKRLIAARLRHQRPFLKSSEVVDLEEYDWEVLGESAPLTGNFLTPVCCSLTGNILLLDDRQNLFLYDVEDFSRRDGAVSPCATERLPGGKNHIADAVSLFEGYAYIPIEEGDSGAGYLIYDLVHRRFLEDRNKALIRWPTNTEIGDIRQSLVGYFGAGEENFSSDLLLLSNQISKTGMSVVASWLGARGESPLAFGGKSPDESTSVDEVRVNVRGTKAGQALVQGEGALPGPRLFFLGGDFSKRYFSDLSSGNVSKDDNFIVIDGKKISNQIQSKQDWRNHMLLDYELLPLSEDQISRANLNFFSPHMQLEDTTNVETHLSVTDTGRLFYLVNTSEVTKNDDNVSSGIIYLLSKSGSEDFDVIYRWDLYDTLLIADPVPETKTSLYSNISRTLEYLHPIKQLYPEMNRLKFFGAPVFRDGMAYVSILGKASGQTKMLILGFRTDVKSLQFYFSEDVKPSSSRFNIEQVDPANMNQLIAMSITNNLYEQETGRFILTSSKAGSESKNALSTSIPLRSKESSKNFWIDPEASRPDFEFEEDGETKAKILPGFSGGRWSPAVFVSSILKDKLGQFYEPLSQPIILGKYLYVVASNRSESLVKLFALDLDSEDETEDAWISVLELDGGDNYTLTAGHNTLFVHSNNRLEILIEQDFLVAGRDGVARLDGRGESRWEFKDSFASYDSLSARKNFADHSLSSSVVPDPISPKTYWIADTGSNSVFQFSELGIKKEFVNQFYLDATFRPIDSLQGNDLFLRSPKDVFAFKSSVKKEENPFSMPLEKERWIHLLVVDSEKSRIIELVNRLDYKTGKPFTLQDPDTREPYRSRRMLFWQSPENFVEGEPIQFVSVDRSRRPGSRLPLLLFGFTGEREGAMLYDPVSESKLIFDNLPGFDASDQKYLFSGVRRASMLHFKKGERYHLSLSLVDDYGFYEWITKDSVDFKSNKDIFNPKNWVVHWTLTNLQLVELLEKTRDQARPQVKLSSQLNEKAAILFARRVDSGEILLLYGNPEDPKDQTGLLLLNGRHSLSEEDRFPDLLLRIITGQYEYARLAY